MTPDYTYVGNELEQAANAINWKNYFGARLKPYLVGNVLEVGAGLGGTTVRLRAESQKSWLCLEPDPGLATQLDATLHATASNVPTRIVVGDLSALSLTDCFDCILYIDVLEHIEDDKGELIRASRHLAAGGSLVVLCPAFMMLYSELDRAIGHYRRYTKSSLAGVFPRDLQQVEIFYLDSLGMFASLANRFFLRQEAPEAGQVKFWDRFIIPVSRMLDPLLLNSVGRSVVAIYRKAGAGAA